MRPQGTVVPSERAEYELELTDSPFRVSCCLWSDCHPDGSGWIGPFGLCSGLSVTGTGGCPSVVELRLFGSVWLFG